MKKNKIILLSISILFLGILVSSSINNEIHTIFSLQVISIKESNKIMEQRQVINENIELFYNESKIPYAKDLEGYLLSQSMTEDYKGLIYNQDFKLKVIKPDKAKGELMGLSEPLKVMAYDDTSYQMIEIIMTNLPVASITSEESDDGIIYGNMILLDSNGGGRENVYESVTSKCSYHVRGASSREYPKKSYKLNLLTDKGKKKKSLLGMREDDDWVLNSLYADKARMREMVGYDIWNQLSQKNQHTMKYTELILDGTYQGVYALQEPVDYKTFSGNKDTDFLFSIKDWEIGLSNRLLYEAEYTEENRLLDEIELESFERTDYEKSTAIIRALVSEVKQKETKDRDQFYFTFDNQSNADYLTFINLIGATDNTYKNEKIYVRRIIGTENSYSIEKTPWDLDATQMSYQLKLWSNPKYTDILVDNLLPKNVMEDVSYRQKVKDKYFESRNTFYNAEYLDKLIDQCEAELKCGGAISRDMERWEMPPEEFAQDVEEIRKFYTERVKALDEYYGGF